MPMDELVVTCPCCGHLFIVAAVPVAGAFDDAVEDVVARAAELGVEIGAVTEGGEDVGY